jgi:solute carrier family 39 (zinc transporter), member 1/2/3
MSHFSSSPLAIRDDDTLNCGSGGGADTFFGLRIASVFIILVGSMFGALFPVLSMKYPKYLRVHPAAIEFAKWFGSGVIIATGFIHLLQPANEELSSLCLAPAWQDYPYAFAFCLLSIFAMFVVELVAFRWGTAVLERIGVSNVEGHGHGPEAAAHGHESIEEKSAEEGIVPQSLHKANGGKPAVLDSPLTRILGVAILEFGVLLHSVLIGLTLAVDPDFKILFIVIVFHQTFEGLGVGARLGYMQADLPAGYKMISIYGALLYGITTPIGIAVGLGVRSSYNPGSTTASIVSGVMDALSSGVLIYTGLVELLAHEFLFSTEMQGVSNTKLTLRVGTMLLGCGLMALLGKWA